MRIIVKQHVCGSWPTVLLLVVAPEQRAQLVAMPIHRAEVVPLSGQGALSVQFGSTANGLSSCRSHSMAPPGQGAKPSVRPGC